MTKETIKSTEKEKVDYIFSLITRAQAAGGYGGTGGVGALKSFSFSWDVIHISDDVELYPNISVEYCHNTNS